MPIEMDDVRNMLEDLEQNEHNLTAWETQFVDSIDNQLGRGHNLTVRQIQTIEKIWREKVPAPRRSACI